MRSPREPTHRPCERCGHGKPRQRRDRPEKRPASHDPQRSRPPDRASLIMPAQESERLLAPMAPRRRGPGSPRCRRPHGPEASPRRPTHGSAHAQSGDRARGPASLRCPRCPGEIARTRSPARRAQHQGHGRALRFGEERLRSSRSRRAASTAERFRSERREPVQGCGASSPHDAGIAVAPVYEREPSLGRLWLPAPSCSRSQVGDVDSRCGGRALARPAENQQLVDGMRQAVELRSRGVSLGAGFRDRSVSWLLESEAQPGERRTQLV